jgi:hypothetical protein
MKQLAIQLRDFFKRLLPESVYLRIRSLLLPLVSLRLVDLRKDTIYRGKPTYYHEHLMAQTNCDFLKDPRFMESYAFYDKVQVQERYIQHKIYWRLHVIFWAATQAMKLEGDFVECGVYRGGMSRALINYIDFEKSGRSFYLLDTYAGVEEKYVTSAEKELGIGSNNLYETDYYDDVVATFKEFPSVKVIRGPVPETLPQAKTNKVAYMSIDMNNVTPEIAAAEYFWVKLVSGAIVIIDDYGWAAWINTKLGWDEFAASKGIEVLSLPTGQGLIVKP